MSEPLFKVGEEVILQCDTHPHFNGEYVVEDVVPKGIHSINGHLFEINSQPFGYKLEGIEREDVPKGRACYFGQRWLKKKYPKSDQSFCELIGSIKEKSNEIVEG